VQKILGEVSKVLEATLTSGVLPITAALTPGTAPCTPPIVSWAGPAVESLSVLPFVA
jgi:hypothetical protein